MRTLAEEDCITQVNEDVGEYDELPKTGGIGLDAASGRDWLRILGVVGIPVSAQDAMLVSLVTGQSCLLVGPQGCCKTRLVALVARELGQKCTIIDVSKACFEDIIGLFNPRSLAEGRIEYIPTSFSIYDAEFLGLDDFSRMSPHLANKYMEIIRNRSLLGRPLPRLAHCWASMNPPGTGEFVGTYAMDRAVLSRFTICIQIPSIADMEDVDVLDAISACVDPADTPLIACEIDDSEPRTDLRTVITAARQRYWDLWEGEHRMWALYLKHLRTALVASQGGGSDVASRIDGRGMAGLLKAIIARRSLEEIKHPDTRAEAAEYIGQLIQHSFPLLRYLDGVSQAPFESAHVLAVEESGIGPDNAGKMSYSLKFQCIPIAKIAGALLQQRAKVDAVSEGIIIRRMSQTLTEPKNNEEAGHALACLIRLLAGWDSLPVADSFKSRLDCFETCYLQENGAALGALLDALGLDPEALSDRFLLLALTYLSNRELKRAGSAKAQGRRGPTLSYVKFLRLIRSDSVKWLRDTESMATTLRSDMETAITQQQDDDYFCHDQDSIVPF